MNIHEYQAKKILQRYGVPIPDFGVAESAEEIKSLLDKLGLEKAVVKIQVHAGGRGKAGGVKLGKNRAEVLEFASQLIGMQMVNNQTGPEGVVARQVMITAPVEIEKEYYLGAVIDRENARAILIASPDGGVEIEEIAHKTPERILKLPIPLNGKLRRYHLLNLANFMGWKGETAKIGMEIGRAVALAFIETDASLLEINPLIQSKEGKLWALDAKISIDDNALFRQKEIASFYDASQVSANEAAAHQHELAYISLSGNIGCMVNGAGLAMATMDTIKYYGGQPANFLDVGGGASEEKVAEGFKIILSDPSIEAILVNIFGGIMDCAVIAKGVIAAAKQLSIRVPLIVRLEGTNVKNGKKILAESGLAIIAADSLADAAKKAVEQVKG